MRNLVALLLMAGLLVAAPVPKQAQKKPASLEGIWEVVEFYSNGDATTVSSTTRWVIDGQNLQIERISKFGVAEPQSPATITLTKPEGGPANALDYTVTYRNDPGTPSRVLPGVVEVDGDTLKFCWANALKGAERLTECKPVRGTGYYVFKRVDEKSR